MRYAVNSSWHANLASPQSLAGMVQMNGSASVAPDGNVSSASKTMRSRGPPQPRLWAYAYDISLVESEDSLPSIQELLEREHSEARAGARKWAAQVVEPQITRILVVSDSPAQDRAVNRDLKAALTGLRATFVVTAPIVVSPEDILTEDAE